MENNESKDNNSEEELEQNTLKNKVMKTIRRKKIIIDTDKVKSIINALNYFLSELYSLENLSTFLTQDNLYFFYSFALKDDIKINILLSKIYFVILSKDYLYSIFLPSFKQDEIYKIDIILELTENISFVMSKIDNFIFSYEIFEIKKKSLGLLNLLYNNCKNKLSKDKYKLDEIVELIDSLLKKYYSKVFNELRESKDIFELLKSKDLNKLIQFEEKLSQINNYFEQFEIFKKFVEINTDINLPKNEISLENINNTNSELIDFYERFGVLLLKFCTYHNYIFLEKEEENIIINVTDNINNQNDNEKNKINSEEIEDKAKIIFLIDKIKNNDNKDFLNLDKNQKVAKVLMNKRFSSSLATKQYYELIIKAIKFYLNHIIKNIKTHPKLKPIKDNLCYFLDSFEVESYFPLYLNNLNKMIINDGFTKAYVTNVFPGEANKIYFDVNFKDDTLIFLECYLEDRTKDINFELNIYDDNTNKFKPVFRGERTDENLKIFINSSGYCIYEVIFDNKYSWFNNKYVNFRVCYLNPISDEPTDEMFDNENFFVVNKEHFFYKPRRINNNINITNIPIIINSNILTTASSYNNEEIIFKEHIEDEIIASKFYFNYVLSSYFKKNKIVDQKKLFISIFSQNEDLTKNNKELQEQLEDCLNSDDKKSIKYLGFCPDKEINNYKLVYKLYDLDEQLVINHKLLKYKQELDKNEEGKKNYIIKNLLLINVDGNMIHPIFFNKGEFYKQFTCPNSKEINFIDIDINKEEEIFNLIKEVNDNIKVFDLLLRNDDNFSKKKKDIIEKIKIYCNKKIKPQIPFYEYNSNDICKNIIKYIYSFNIN